MRYRLPFDLAQRQRAVRHYRSLRRNYKVVRAMFPPQTEDEHRTLRDYSRVIRLFGEELIQADVYVDSERLNDLDQRAILTLGQYFEKKLKGGRHP